MLVLSRKKNEKLLIGHDVKITVVEIFPDRVRLGVEAPDQVRVVRAELAKNWRGRKKAGDNGVERPPA